MADSAVQENENREPILSEYSGKIISQKDLYNIFPFGETKMKKIIKSGKLPLVKFGNDYVTTFKILENWLENNVGEEIYYD